MKKYIYKGQISYTTVDGKDYCFEDGQEYSLPEANAHVIVLIASGTLIVSEEKKETTLKK